MDLDASSIYGQARTFHTTNHQLWTWFATPHLVQLWCTHEFSGFCIVDNSLRRFFLLLNWNLLLNLALVKLYQGKHELLWATIENVIPFVFQIFRRGESVTSSGMLIVTPFGNVFQPMQVRELSRTLQRLGTFTSKDLSIPYLLSSGLLIRSRWGQRLMGYCPHHLQQ